MKIVINKKNILDRIILFLMYMQLVILEFFGMGQLMNKVITALIIIRLFSFIKSKKIKVKWSVLLLIVLFVFSVLLGNNISLLVLKSNFLLLMYPIIYTYYISCLCRYKKDFIDSIVRKLFPILNITLILNLIVLIIQIKIPGLIVAKVVGTEIGFFEDTVSGLFAYASTHVVCLFIIAVISYDILFLNRIKKKRYKNLVIIYIFLISIISFCISIFNDNKAIFILLPLMMLIVWYANQKTVNGRIRRIFFSIAFLLIITSVLYLFNENLRLFLDENIFDTVRMFMDSMNIGNQANGSNERIAILGYSLSKVSTWFCGIGLGSHNFYESNLEGFRHFGQSDLGTLLMLGGIWFTILLIYLYYLMLKNISGTNQSNPVILFGIFFILISSLMYTQCVTRVNCTSCLILVALAYRNLCFSKIERNRCG